MSYRSSVYRKSTVYRDAVRYTKNTVWYRYKKLSYRIYGIPKNSVQYRYDVLSYRNFRYGIRYDTQSMVYRTEPPLGPCDK